MAIAALIYDIVKLVLILKKINDEIKHNSSRLARLLKRVQKLSKALKSLEKLENKASESELEDVLELVNNIKIFFEAHTAKFVISKASSRVDDDNKIQEFNQLLLGHIQNLQLAIAVDAKRQQQEDVEDIRKDISQLRLLTTEYLLEQRKSDSEVKLQLKRILAHEDSVLEALAERDRKTAESFEEVKDMLNTIYFLLVDLAKKPTYFYVFNGSSLMLCAFVRAILWHCYFHLRWRWVCDLYSTKKEEKRGRQQNC